MAGIPDILFWRKGVAYAFEVKRPGEPWGLTELQRITMQAMQKQGVVVAVVHSPEEVMAVIGEQTPESNQRGRTRVHLDFTAETMQILTEDVSEFLEPNRGG